MNIPCDKTFLLGSSSWSFVKFKYQGHKFKKKWPVRGHLCFTNTSCPKIYSTLTQSQSLIPAKFKLSANRNIFCLVKSTDFKFTHIFTIIRVNFELVEKILHTFDWKVLAQDKEL